MAPLRSAILSGKFCTAAPFSQIVTENGFAWHGLEWWTHPLSQILRICQLPRKGELLTHPQGLHFIWKLRRYCKKLPLRGSWRTNVSLRGFSMLKANKKPIPQRRAFAESGAVNAVSLYDPICEKAIQENPQIFLNCNYKINFSLNMPRARRRAFKIVPA